ncbi:MAG TPA: aspartate aminotransferase family protein [Kofleriaceae bacterium]
MIPEHGRAPDEVLAELAGKGGEDTDWRGGRVFSLVYHAGHQHEELLHRAHALYASANLLNPMAFKSLKAMERDIVQSAGSLFNCSGAVGTVTSGGTESILCAVAAYRDRARKKKPWVRSPELVVPRTIHPAFDKAAHYFGVKLVKVDVDAEQRADVRKMAKAIGWRTIGMVASAPQYPHGVIDPIAELGEIAMEKKLPLHVDACVGGFMLPWLEKLGRPIPKWDFRVPGVTSISADLHKYAYAAKGASLLLWRSIEDMKFQIFVATDFPGGIYASPTLIGTRPGGPIAAAWAALQTVGVNGYLELARRAVDAADQLRAGIREIPGLVLLGRPDATIVSYASVGADIYALADRLEARGWSVDRQHRPSSIHLTVTANHAPIVQTYLSDLRECLAEVRANPSLSKSGSAPMYGMAAKMPVRRLVAGQVRKVIAEMYK